MIENRIIPPAATACARKPKREGQSAVPVSSCAFVVINPRDLAASGSFKMTIKSPPASGAIEKPMAVTSGTFERNIFNVSIQSAEENSVILSYPNFRVSGDDVLPKG